MVRVKLKSGDVFAVPTAAGLFLGQYTHPSALGEVVRILDAAFETVPSLDDAVARLPTRFTTLLPLALLIRRGRFQRVGWMPVPGLDACFPLFRAGMVDPRTQLVEVWWLWDGEREWRAGTLDEEQMKLPPRMWMSDAALIEKLESGWSQESADF